MAYQNCLSSLPMNVCIRPSGRSGGRYGIWSLVVIPYKTVFGPYKGLFINGTEGGKGGYQWKVERENSIITLNGSNANTTSWLRYINCACSKEEQNMVVVQHQSEVFYVASKEIPEETELLVWYKDSSIRERKLSKGISSQYSHTDKQSTTNNYAKERNMQDERLMETKQPLSVSCPSLNPVTQLPLLMPSSSLLDKITTAVTQNGNLLSPKMQNNLLTPTDGNGTSVLQSKDIVKANPILSSLLDKITVTQNAGFHLPKIQNNRTPASQNYPTLEIQNAGVTPECRLFKEQDRMNVCTAERNEQDEIATKADNHLSMNSSVCPVTQEMHLQPTVHGNLQILMNQYGDVSKIENVQRNLQNPTIVQTHLHRVVQNDLQTHRAQHLTLNTERDNEVETETLVRIKPKDTTIFKPNECEICHKIYLRKDSLMQHTRDHLAERPYECEICQKSFKHSVNLKVHKLRHAGVKPFECEVCDKRFLDSRDLNCHTRIHTGEKPFECKLCHKKFRFHSSLPRHMKVHAKERA